MDTTIKLRRARGDNVSIRDKDVRLSNPSVSQSVFRLFWVTNKVNKDNYKDLI